MANESPEAKRERILQTLADAGIINPVLLSDEVKEAIGELTDEQVETLLEIHENVVPLEVFFHAKSPIR